jgi:hypothetical protein
LDDPGEIASADTHVVADGTDVAAEHLQQIRKLQGDLQLLMKHMANLPDKVGSPSWASTAAPASNGDGLEGAAGLLVLQPEQIARDSRLLSRLYAAVGELTRLVAPADVSSIRLTHAFVRGGDNVEGPAYIAREAHRLRRWTWTSAAFGLAVFVVTMLLLIHVDRGRRIVQELKELRLEQGAAENDLSVARTASAGTVTANDLFGCTATDHDVALPSNPILGQSTQQQFILCQRLQNIQYRMLIVYYQLRMWNLTSDRLSSVSPLSWVTPRPALPANLPEEKWESSDLRTAVLMTALTGVTLPMLLGLLGACVYVYREIDNSIQTFTLAAREGLHGTLRMLLGAILGGLLGAIWTNGQVVDLGGVSLSLGGVALFVGFSVEVVFRFTDTIVQAVAERIGKYKV